ncbi:hypothetical protein ACJX0J_019190, partial [Zea mays]
MFVCANAQLTDKIIINHIWRQVAHENLEMVVLAVSPCACARLILDFAKRILWFFLLPHIVTQSPPKLILLFIDTETILNVHDIIGSKRARHRGDG